MTTAHVISATRAGKRKYAIPHTMHETSNHDTHTSEMSPVDDFELQQLYRRRASVSDKTRQADNIVDERQDNNNNALRRLRRKKQNLLALAANENWSDNKVVSELAKIASVKPNVHRRKKNDHNVVHVKGGTKNPNFESRIDLAPSQKKKIAMARQKIVVEKGKRKSQKMKKIKIVEHFDKGQLATEKQWSKMGEFVQQQEALKLSAVVPSRRVELKRDRKTQERYEELESRYSDDLKIQSKAAAKLPKFLDDTQKKKWEKRQQADLNRMNKIGKRQAKQKRALSGALELSARGLVEKNPGPPGGEDKNAHHSKPKTNKGTQKNKGAMSSLMNEVAALSSNAPPAQYDPKAKRLAQCKKLMNEFLANCNSARCSNGKFWHYNVDGFDRHVVLGDLTTLTTHTEGRLLNALTLEDFEEIFMDLRSDSNKVTDLKYLPVYCNAAVTPCLGCTDMETVDGLWGPKRAHGYESEISKWNPESVLGFSLRAAALAMPIVVGAMIRKKGWGFYKSAFLSLASVAMSLPAVAHRVKTAPVPDRNFIVDWQTLCHVGSAVRVGNPLTFDKKVFDVVEQNVSTRMKFSYAVNVNRSVDMVDNIFQNTSFMITAIKLSQLQTGSAPGGGFWLGLRAQRRSEAHKRQLLSIWLGTVVTNFVVMTASNQMINSQLSAMRERSMNALYRARASGLPLWSTIIPPVSQSQMHSMVRRLLTHSSPGLAAALGILLHYS
jgi:hypothetical protein